MSIKLVVSNTCLVRVKGSLPSSGSTPQNFEFSLICDRMGADELRDLRDSGEDTPLVDIMLAKTRGWEHVLDEHDAPAPFSEEGLRQLLNIVGMAGLAFSSYVQACSAKGREKN